mmetsp:Transcript_6124/g.19062  ORF Transcript_6124/g.19062 Transcript_6124/m.19062 type:complete len:241 (-) Transcript_6124:774-1496(-)
MYRYCAGLLWAASDSPPSATRRWSGQEQGWLRSFAVRADQGEPRNGSAWQAASSSPLVPVERWEGCNGRGQAAVLHVHARHAAIGRGEEQRPLCCEGGPDGWRARTHLSRRQPWRHLMAPLGQERHGGLAREDDSRLERGLPGLAPKCQRAGEGLPDVADGELRTGQGLAAPTAVRGAAARALQGCTVCGGDEEPALLPRRSDHWAGAGDALQGERSQLGGDVGGSASGLRSHDGAAPVL